MKKTFIFLTTLFFLALGSLSAQTLGFNRILLVSSVEDTVPVGKVWKVVSGTTGAPYHYIGGGSCTYDDNSMEIRINGGLRYISDMVAYGGTTTRMMVRSMPLWLPASTRLRTTCANTTLSVIEFTVTL